MVNWLNHSKILQQINLNITTNKIKWNELKETRKTNFSSSNFPWPWHVTLTLTGSNTLLLPFNFQYHPSIHNSMYNYIMDAPLCCCQAPLHSAHPCENLFGHQRTQLISIQLNSLQVSFVAIMKTIKNNMIQLWIEVDCQFHKAFLVVF